MEAQLHDAGGRKLLGGSTKVAACAVDCAVVLFRVLLIILTGERVSDKHSGGPVCKRQTCELDFKIKKLKEFANGQTPTSLRREFDLRTSVVKTILENRQHINVRGSAQCCVSHCKLINL
jgi:hypothetical protein